MHWKSAYGIGSKKSTSAPAARISRTASRPSSSGPRVHARDRDHELAVQVLRDALLGRGVEVQERQAEPLRRFAHRVAIEGQQLAPAADGIQRETAEDLGLERVQPELERGDPPKLPPPPRSAQNRSGCSSAEARTCSPSALTSSTASRLSQARPCLRSSHPEPPPSVSPATPVVDTRPPVVARSYGWVARSNCDHVAAEPTRDPAVPVHLDRRHVAHVDHEPVVDERQPGDRVPAGADGERQSLTASVGDRVRDVGRRGAARHERGPTLDHRVVERRGVGVLGRARFV
jgi:hypothetical protein